LETMSTKYLIFATGTISDFPHQIGFKMFRNERISKKRRELMLQKNEARVEPDDFDASVKDNSDDDSDDDLDPVDGDFDTVDEIVDLHGFLFGMNLSPDHRYLYVQSVDWSSDYNATDPLEEPPVGQEVKIHIFDMTTLKKVDHVFQSHKNYSVNDDGNHCLIYPHVCENYLASGGDDNHAYVWDRHYGNCLAKNPHTNIVNCVAFNPTDSEMLVTTSDDYTIKIWRSMNMVRELGIDLNK